jgi:hypothetical protein
MHDDRIWICGNGNTKAEIDFVAIHLSFHRALQQIQCTRER